MVARILAARGVTDPVAATRLLAAGAEALRPPSLLAGIDDAVEAILGAIARSERIAICGDYDVDGLTASSILYWVIRKLRGVCDVVVPHRNRDGYGFSIETVGRLASGGVRLVVTVDNGTSAVREIDAAGELGLQVVVIDHHEPGSELPRARALVNPLQARCDYPFKGLAAVGLVHKVGETLLARSGLPGAEELAGRFFEATVDLVAVGTLADMVPLVDENRALVKLGLAGLSRTAHPGIRSLLREGGIAGGAVSSEWVTFKLVPMLNAAGRVADPFLALDFLLSRDPREAGSLARSLTALNRKRARLVESLWMEARSQEAGWKNRLIPVSLLVTPYRGLMGLVAMRMRETMGRPAIALASDGTRAFGSARSVDGFHVTRALSAVSAHLEQYGGHEQAAGLTLECGKVDSFVEALEAHVAGSCGHGPVMGGLFISGEVTRGDLSRNLPEALELLAPFGQGNPSPVFALRRVRVSRVARFGSGGRHCTLACPDLPADAEVVGFGLAPAAQEAAAANGVVDLAFKAELKSSGSCPSLVLRLEDLRASG
jgi:single-stranded-DNA-specific exonuclease